MRSSPRLANASPPTARKPALKRRRVNVNVNGIDSEFHSGRALTDNSNLSPMPNALPPSLYAKLSCSTCHRTLSAAIRPGVPGAYAVCSRCSAPTCAVCSRTCTSYTRPPSFPPTPALTRSPSPSTHAATPVSPKRAALCVSHAAMNCDTSVPLPLPPAYTLPSIKRKKAPADKDADVDGDPNGVGRDYQLHHHYDGSDTFASTLGDVYRDATDSVVVPGCGRVVCRACCIESIPNDGKLCVDCFALV